MSDYQSLLTDPTAGEAESNFQKIPLTPKYGLSLRQANFIQFQVGMMN